MYVTNKDLQEVKAWRDWLTPWFRKIGADNLEGNWDLYAKYRDYMVKKMGVLANKAFAKFYRFHELEYKLFILQREYDKNNENVDNLIDFTEHEINRLYEWLKIYMIVILDSRLVMYGGNSDMDKMTDKISTEYSKERLNDPKTWRTTWHSIDAAYILLRNAKTTGDKIKAITLSLNAAHDGGVLFIQDEHDFRAGDNKVAGPIDDKSFLGWTFAPFTLDQYNKLNYINPNKVKLEIQKDLQT